MQEHVLGWGLNLEKNTKKKTVCTLSGTVVNCLRWQKKITYEHIFRVSNVYIFIPTQLKCCKMMTVSSKTEKRCFGDVMLVLQTMWNEYMRSLPP